jgi:tRNA pseudouridine55 synthase
LNDNNCVGFALVDKPEGIPSFRVITRIRKITQVKKVGHAGTLDPFSSGLLIVAIGREFTREISGFQGQDKSYLVRMVLGIETDTLDSYGKIDQKQVFEDKIDIDNVESVISSFVGVQMQVPPMFSAKQINGKRMYRLARQGKKVDIPPVEIDIKQIKLISVFQYTYPIICFEVQCSKGTYVRSLVRDIAYKLNSVGYTKDLRRLNIGSFSVKDAIRYDALNLDVLKKGLMTSTSSFDPKCLSSK